MNGSAAHVILCVDDDPEILHFERTLLEESGYRVIAVENGTQALMAALGEKPDVILLDVTMSDLNGYDVCAKLQLRKETAYIPVVMVTALTGDRDKVQALRVGAADYLVKPIDPAAMLACVKSLLKTGDRWREIKEDGGETRGAPRWDGRLKPSEYARFKEFLAGRRKLTPDERKTLGGIAAPDLYSGARSLGFDSKDVAQALSEFLKIPYAAEIDPQSLRLGVLPTAFCRTNHIVASNDAFFLSNPFNWEVLDAIRRTLDRERSTPKLVLTEPENVQNLLDPKTQAGSRPPAKIELSDIEAKLREEYRDDSGSRRPDDVVSEQSAPVIQLVNNLIETGYVRGASDIHIEPTEDEVIVRYRVDGDLAIANRLRPARLIQPVIARLKIMSQLDISERRLPQDGRIKFKPYSLQGHDFDLRVATAPQNHGEKAVLRIIDKQKSVMPLENLGFSPRNLDLYRKKIASPYGMILHVGPTGSGKSMTLYAALNELKSESINIQTAEDPIEYTLPGINQLQVKKEIGLNFSRALRSFLRLDPDVILVGEIRDRETAETAIEASLTGHLLLSTLHTNDAASTVTRFIEMGIEPYMVGSSLLLVCAQRLIRRLCTECKEAYQPDAAGREFVGALEGESIRLYRPHGCERCGGTGYRGRVGIHEVFVPDDEIRTALVKKGTTSESLKRLAVKAGMTTLFWDAMEKVRNGLCSVEDALSNVQPDEFDSKPVLAARSRCDLKARSA